MDEKLIIEKNSTLPPSQDYYFLRKEGINYIENLGSEFWTDFNSHDPGITILEVLCYAISELGYRCGFDINDLLTKEDGNIVDNQTFFTAKRILTNNPLTINDYRKLLIDLDGIHNAWLIADKVWYDDNKNPLPVNEVHIYADCKKDKLTYNNTGLPLYISGLYKVLIDLEYTDGFGDLNNGEIIIENPANGNISQGEFLFSIELPSWKDADFSFAENAKDKVNILSVIIEESENHWKCKSLKLTNNSVKEFNITMPLKPEEKNVTVDDVQKMFNDKQFVAGIFEKYFNKIRKARQIIQSAIKILHEHRNLCEDFTSVTTIEDEKIAFCFDVDAKPDTDIDKIQAEIFFIVENYLNPNVGFYSLKELIEKKVPVDGIFNGVVLKHGFIENTQLEETQLRSKIITSDIINLLMDIEGVVAIRNFTMTKYGKDGMPMKNYTGKKWCMNISPMCKPVLSKDRSKILLFKNQFPFIARYDEVKDTILLLHAQRSRAKLSGLQDDIPVPIGKKRDTESYYPVQYDLPPTYGTGEYGLTTPVTAQRIASQRQLKAYLMFFEQLLADFFSQLTHSHRLFSVEEIKNTYYAQFLSGIKEVKHIYKTVNGNALLEQIINNPDSVHEPKNKWQILYESKDLFEERRSRFLDHLLARFSESFSDYALMMYRINYKEKTEENIDPAELLAAKIRTLKIYDQVSSSRSKSFNYLPQNNDFTIDRSGIWDTDNVSGLERRISLLTGINDYTRRFLYCIKNIEIYCNEESVDENEKEVLKCYYSFSITSLDGIKMLSGKYENKENARKEALDAVILGKNSDNYTWDNNNKNFKLANILTSEKTYTNEEDANNDIKKFTEEFKRECNDPVGLHLIEHILLRPRKPAFDLMEVCLHNCECICDADPYSYRISVIMPYWPGHFDSMAFREYFENKIREEAPAHVMLKICWLSNEMLREFEVRYKNWLESIADYYSDTADLDKEGKFRDANNAILEILKNLHSEYILATLHNCDENKESSNPLLLGKTILGTFNKL
ncbi:MAG: hypothetical protein EHM58_02300 [Ignavibacteriae bacterium]|nr:MAG: hypothetical protein EHM58_02300 [Ignavibacteriota bacterium]